MPHPPMIARSIDGHQVSAIGLGCMGFSHAYGHPPHETEAIRVIHAAIDQGVTPSQLALAWLLHQGEHILPIPGTTNAHHLAENIAAAPLSLSDEQIQRINACINQHTVSGMRYTPSVQADIDTEEFVP